MSKWLVLLALFVASVSSVHSEQVLSIGHTGVGISPTLYAAKAFAADLKRRLPGRFDIDDRGGSTRGGDVNLWDGIQVGALDVAILATPSIVPFVPEFGVLDIPFLFRDAAHVAAVLDGPVGQEIGEKLNGHGVVFLGFADYGFRQLTNSKRAVVKPADLIGLRIRIIQNPVMEMIFKALGAETVPIPFTEVYGALDDGRVDGQENPLPTIEAYRFSRVQKYVSLTAHVFTPLVIMMNAEVYKTLKPAEQQAIRAAVRDTESALLAEFRKQGLVVSEAVDREAFARRLASLNPVWDKQFGVELVRRIRDTR